MITEREALEALPRQGFIRDYTLAMAKQTDANLAYHIPSAAVVLSQTVPIDVGLPQGGFQPIHANFYGLLVGSSTDSRKTTAINAAKWLQKLSSTGFISPHPGSHEQFIDSFVDQAKMALYYEEFGDFLSKTLPRSYLHPLRQSFTDIYDGSEASRAIKAKGKKQRTCENPRLSVLGGINPDYLEDYTIPNDWMGGFLGRFFTIRAERERDIDLRPTEMPEAIQLIARLETLAARCLSFEEVNSKTLPKCRGMTVPAQRLWTAWVKHTRTSHAGSTDAEVRAAIARSQGMASKLAILNSWDWGELSRAGEGDDWWISSEEMESALKMTDLHVRSVVEIGRRLAPNGDTRDKKKVQAFIFERRGVTLGQISDHCKIVGFLRRLRDILQALEEERLVDRVTQGSGKPDLWFPRAEDSGGDGGGEVIELFRRLEVERAATATAALSTGTGDGYLNRSETLAAAQESSTGLVYEDPEGWA